METFQGFQQQHIKNCLMDVSLWLDQVSIFCKLLVDFIYLIGSEVQDFVQLHFDIFKAKGRSKEEMSNDQNPTESSDPEKNTINHEMLIEESSPQSETKIIQNIINTNKMKSKSVYMQYKTFHAIEVN